MAALKKKDIIAKLKSLGIKADPGAGYNDLRALLKKVEAEQPTEEVTKEKAPEKEETPERITPDSPTQKEKDPLSPPENQEEAIEEARKNPFFSLDSKQPLTGKAHAMRKRLMYEEKVTVYIPLGSDELVGSTHQVTLNGYPMFIRKGEYVDVPLSVKKVIEAKMRHELNVRNHPARLKGGLASAKLQDFD